MATNRTPISAKSILAAAPLSWTLVDESSTTVIVSVTTRHERDNAPLAGSQYLLTRDVEIMRDSWDLSGWVDGPSIDSDDASELCADVARAFESGRGVRYRDVFACAEAA